MSTFPKINLNHEDLLICLEAYKTFPYQDYLCYAINEYHTHNFIDDVTCTFLENAIRDAINPDITLGSVMGNLHDDQRQLRFDWLDQELTRTAPTTTQEQNNHETATNSN